MKKALLSFALMVGIASAASAQYRTKMDGTPDMRYRQNKELYGTPSLPSYSTPRSSSSTYTPSYSNERSLYSTPSYPTYPTKRDGTLDMRYKENRQINGLTPW